MNTLVYQESLCPAIACQLDDIRLRNGQNKFEGRMEVCDGGHWKTVCSNMWDNKVANVACRQIGFTGISSCKSNSSLFYISKVGR